VIKRSGKFQSKGSGHSLAPLVGKGTRLPKISAPGNHRCGGGQKARPDPNVLQDLTPMSYNTILVIFVNRFTPVAQRRDVIKRSGKFQAKGSGHSLVPLVGKGTRLPKNSAPSNHQCGEGQKARPDPCFFSMSQDLTPVLTPIPSVNEIPNACSMGATLGASFACTC
jgi:hypothetical protein